MISWCSRADRLTLSSCLIAMRRMPRMCMNRLLVMSEITRQFENEMMVWWKRMLALE